MTRSAGRHEVVADILGVTPHLVDDDAVLGEHTATLERGLDALLVAVYGTDLGLLQHIAVVLWAHALGELLKCQRMLVVPG